MVITDIFMPEQDGIGFLTDLMGDGAKLPCPVIAVSGRERGSQYLNIAKQLGVDEVFSKPFNLPEINQMIIKLLS